MNALYTVITGDYDTPLPIPSEFRQGIDCFLFTDDPDLKCEGFKSIIIEPSEKPVMRQRAYKISVPGELKAYDKVMYIDANIRVIRPLDQVFKSFKGGITTIHHPKRNCVYQEGFACIEAGKAKKEDIETQLQEYIEMGIRPGGGMYQTGVVIRGKGLNPAFSAKWWELLIKYTHRDQLSVTVARDLIGQKIDAVPYTSFVQFFKIEKHRPKSKEPLEIHYLQPYATDKNIGRAYNEAISRISNPDAWIVLMDYDAMFTTPDYGRIIENALRNTDCMLLGAYTNRIRADHQKVDGLFNEYDMRAHLTVGKQREEEFGSEIEIINQGVAGFCMIFQKKTWDKIKFLENDITFDTKFYQGVRKLKGKVGLLKGVYMFHCYRLLSPDPLNESSHLKLNR